MTKLYDRCWLAKRRLSAGLSQTEAAELAGVAQGMYNRYEAGIGKPGVVPGLKLAKALGFDPDEWLNERELA